MSATARIGGLALVLAMIGCGQGHGALFLTLDARGPAGELAIPSQVDTLALVISLADGGAPLLTRQFPLPAGTTFPQTLGIDPESLAESELAVTASAMEDGGVVGSSSTVIPIPASKVASVTMVIVAP